ncbi:MAG: hypothetical protein ACR2KZ_16910 [Segetibacter sp.]
MADLNNTIHFSEELVTEQFSVAADPKENETDPKQKPEVEPEKLPKEDPGQPGTEPDEDDDDDDPFTETEIGDDPDEIEKKTTIF